jgi:hypothetical protein
MRNRDTQPAPRFCDLPKSSQPASRTSITPNDAAVFPAQPIQSPDPRDFAPMEAVLPAIGILE